MLAIEERVLGPEHPSTLASRMSLASALSSQDKHTEAEQEKRAVLAVQVRVLGPEHPNTLGSRMNLANALYSQDRPAEAEQEHRSVLAIQERVLGAEHPDVCLNCYNLARALRKQNKYQEALTFARRAEDGWAKIFGTHHRRSEDVKMLCEVLKTEIGSG